MWIPPNLGRGLDGRVGVGAGRTRLTLVRELRGPGSARLTALRGLIVSRLGLGGQVGELCGGSRRIALEYLRFQGRGGTGASPPVADRVGEVASFFGGRARHDRVTRDGRGPARLPGRGSG